MDAANKGVQPTARPCRENDRNNASIWLIAGAIRAVARRFELIFVELNRLGSGAGAVDGTRSMTLLRAHRG